MHLSPESLLAVHHAEHAERVAERHAPVPSLARPVLAAYVAVLRLAYVHARAAHAASSQPA